MTAQKFKMKNHMSSVNLQVNDETIECMAGDKPLDKAEETDPMS